MYEVTVLENPFIPDPVKEGIFAKQAEFLCYEGREALYGGAAGGGKSVALLVAALQYATEPHYDALILRRTYQQLAKADSILSKAKDWLMGRDDVRWREQDHTFTFPSGATLQFSHMEHENAVYNYQGGIWKFIGVDEVTQFTPSMISYPRTRQRRNVNDYIPIRWRGGTNPGGLSHDYIRERYVKDKLGRNPQTADRRFFPAKLADNPHIDKDDYITQLRESGIDGVLLAQLLDGDWDAVVGGRFKAEWFGWSMRDPYAPDFMILLDNDGTEIERFQWHRQPTFQTCDPAASKSAAADHFVLSTWMISPKSNIIHVACERGKFEIDEQVSLCQRSYMRHHPQFVGVEEIMNQRALAQLLRKSRTPPMVVLTVGPGGNDKLAHATGAIVLASTKRIFLTMDNPGYPLDAVVSELTRFRGVEKEADDIVDTFSTMADSLSRVRGGTIASKGSVSLWHPK